MLLVKLAWRNLLRHVRKTVLLGSLIAVVMAVLLIANSVFESTNTGLEQTFIGSFTGNAAIGAAGSKGVSLFGNEVPIVNEYDTISPISVHSEIMELLNKLPSIESETSIVSTPARMEIGRYRVNVPLFGIEPKSYFDVCRDVTVVTGDVSSLSDSGVFLNSVLASRTEEALGRPLAIGEPVVFSMYVGRSFKIRTAPFRGVYSYPGTTEALDRVVLADLTTVRSLADYTLGYRRSDQLESETEEDLFNMDDLFTEDLDVAVDTGAGISINEIETSLQDSERRDSLVLTDDGAWSFILLRAEQENASDMIKELKRQIRVNNLDVSVLSWREAAGSTAQVLFAVQIIFYIGLGFIGIGAVLVIMNALVISVLEQTNEIGTMRSIGASSNFIRRLFLSESMILTAGSGAIGIILGIIVVLFIGKTGLTLENPVLISLFGGSAILPQVSLKSALLHFLLVVMVGAVSWFYPVLLATRIQPVTAMNR